MELPLIEGGYSEKLGREVVWRSAWVQCGYDLLCMPCADLASDFLGLLERHGAADQWMKALKELARCYELCPDWLLVEKVVKSVQIAEGGSK